MASSAQSSFFPGRLVGRVALVTGGANGIGESITRLFLKHGAKVCIADIHDDAGHRLLETLTAGDDVVYFHCDVSIEEDVQQAVDHALAKFGTLDVIVNNAAYIGPKYRDIRDCQISEFERVFSVNVKGVFLGMKHAARVMIPAKKGSIINLCSISGIVAGVGSHAYSGSKHGVLGLTKSAALELGKHGIRVNCVSPYVIMTKLVVDRLPEENRSQVAAGLRSAVENSANLKGVELSTEDIANSVLFLASDESRYVSAANLVVDGGFTAVNNSFRVFG